MDRSEKIEQRIRQALSPQHFALEDVSHRHRGHAGAASGAGHFEVVVVSSRFEGMNRVARHRAVYSALGAMIPDEVHALSAQAFTPAEWDQQTGNGPPDR